MYIQQRNVCQHINLQTRGVPVYVNRDRTTEQLYRNNQLIVVVCAHNNASYATKWATNNSNRSSADVRIDMVWSTRVHDESHGINFLLSDKRRPTTDSQYSYYTWNRDNQPFWSRR